MRKSTIAFVELGMIGGIILAGYTLPDDTPLYTFLIISGGCFVVGNVVLFTRARRASGLVGDEPKSRFWNRIFRALAILAVGWILVILLCKR